MVIGMLAMIGHMYRRDEGSYKLEEVQRNTLIGDTGIKVGHSHERQEAPVSHPYGLSCLLSHTPDTFFSPI